MKLLGSLQRHSKALQQEGRVLLLLQWDTPTGTTPAALHFTQTVEKLLAYAQSHYLPDARAAWDRAQASGTLATFSPLRYCVRLSEQPVTLRSRKGNRESASRVLLKLHLTLYQTPPHRARELLLEKRLVTCWDNEGRQQYPLPRSSG